MQRKDPQNCRMKQCTGNSRVVFDNQCPQSIKLAQKYVTNTYFRLFNTEVSQDFVNHARCNTQFQKSIQNCAPILTQKYKESKLITYKGLRVTMTSVERMLQLDPDLHIVYLVRDPRGTVTSRVNIKHTYRDTKNNVVLEAKYHCVKMMEDLKVYARLMNQYPGAILLVKYEDVSVKPYDEIKRIYDFFGMKVHKSVFDWMRENEKATTSGGSFSTARANSTASVDKWRRANTPIAQDLMTYYCKDVLKALDYEL